MDGWMDALTWKHLFFEAVICFAWLFREGDLSDPVLLLEPELHQLQLDLLSRFDPKHLLTFLQTSQHYRLEEAILVLSASLPFVFLCVCVRARDESVFVCR